MGAAQKSSLKTHPNPSGSYKENVLPKPQGPSRITCFHCKQQRHQSFDRPKQITFIEGEGDVKNTPDDPEDKEIPGGC